MRAKAFAPGHVTCFFVIKDRHRDVRKKGNNIETEAGT